MNPGELNCRVMLERLAKVADDSGGYEETYLPYAKVWAKMTPKKSGQKETAEQVMFGAVYEIILRYRKDVEINDRISYTFRTFRQIAPVVNIGEKNTYLKLTVEEVIEDD
jgi:SPP1 family predicted phage head-tail adaptor